jgi:hypothetical protein
MHLKIDNLYLKGNSIGIDFEYDEDFRYSVARACGVSYISKRDLQLYVICVMKDVLDTKELLKLGDEVY